MSIRLKVCGRTYTYRFKDIKWGRVGRFWLCSPFILTLVVYALILRAASWIGSKADDAYTALNDHTEFDEHGWFHIRHKAIRREFVWPPPRDRGTEEDS